MAALSEPLDQGRKPFDDSVRPELLQDPQRTVALQGVPFCPFPAVRIIADNHGCADLACLDDGFGLPLMDAGPRPLDRQEEINPQTVADVARPVQPALVLEQRADRSPLRTVLAPDVPPHGCRNVDAMEEKRDLVQQIQLVQGD